MLLCPQLPRGQDQAPCLQYLTSAGLAMPRARGRGAAGSGPLPLAVFFFMAAGRGSSGGS